MNNYPDYLVLCKNENFMLPVYEHSLHMSNKTLGHLNSRYLNALLLDRAGKSRKIVNIEPVGNGWFNKIISYTGLINQGIRCSFVDSDINFADALSMIKIIAISPDSYSVWAQFYDSECELLNCLDKCQNLDEVLQALHATDAGAVSEILV